MLPQKYTGFTSLEPRDRAVILFPQSFTNLQQAVFAVDMGTTPS